MSRARSAIHPGSVRSGKPAVRLPSSRSMTTASETPVDRTDLSIAGQLITAAQTIVLLAHVGPDADALGSALALGLALRKNGAEVTVSFAEPSSVPESLRALPGQHLIKPVEGLPSRPDLVVTLDVNSRERLGSLAGMLDTAKNSLVIDHHASNTRF